MHYNPEGPIFVPMNEKGREFVLGRMQDRFRIVSSSILIAYLSTRYASISCPVQGWRGHCFIPCEAGAIMAFRISTRRTKGGTVVRIEGRLDATAVRGLLAECRSVGTSFRLDLVGLKSADADGVRALRALRDQGTEFLGMSPYIRHLIFEDCGETRD